MDGKFLWQAGDLEPNWLQAAPADQRRRMADLLRTAPRSREETARHMLVSPPWPVDAENAEARLLSVIGFLSETTQ